jgi:hypothetical protein
MLELPDDAVGKVRTDPWNVAHCDQCDLGFDYDDEEVQFVADQSQVPSR